MDVSNPSKGLDRKGDPQKEKRLQNQKRSLAMGTGFYQSGRWQPGYEVQGFC